MVPCEILLISGNLHTFFLLSYNTVAIQSQVDLTVDSGILFKYFLVLWVSEQEQTAATQGINDCVKNTSRYFLTLFLLAYDTSTSECGNKPLWSSDKLLLFLLTCKLVDLSIITRSYGLFSLIPNAYALPISLNRNWTKTVHS